MQKFPFMIFVGEQEENDNTITVRQHGGEDLGTITVEDFGKIIKERVNKSLKTFK